MRQIAAEGYYGKMASELVEVKEKLCVIEFFHEDKNAPIDIRRCLLNVYGDKTMDVSTVRRWMVRFNSGDSDVRQATFRLPCAAVSPRNDEHLDQLIRANRRITTRELCTGRMSVSVR